MAMHSARQGQLEVRADGIGWSPGDVELHRWHMKTTGARGDCVEGYLALDSRMTDATENRASAVGVGTEEHVVQLCFRDGGWVQMQGRISDLAITIQSCPRNAALKSTTWFQPIYGRQR